MRKYLDSNVIYKTKDMTKKEWLLKRKEGIGGSDVASILGISPYKSSVSVYMDKVSEEGETNDECTYKLELGNKLEDFVAKEFTLKTNKKVSNVNGILKNEKYPYSIANIDKAVVGERAFLECVVTNSFAKKKYKNEVPSHIKAQCYHYMAITGATHCYVAILVGNEEVIIHKLDRDENAINEIMKIEKEFWETYVLGNNIPLPDGSEDYSKFISGLYENTIDEVLVIFEKEEILNKYDEVKSKIKELDKEKKSMEQFFKSQMGNYEVAFIGDRKLTWKKQSKTIFDTKRFKNDYPELYKDYAKEISSRVFKI
ncbi:MAG: YqaJ viral recombinase family protein [Romboutsia sp.]|nr:YqaJ viral recombinase family protein [Romboutsia sp.]